MSFFFVLSGFVCMLSNKATVFSNTGAKPSFYYRRISKFYPFYLMIWTIDFMRQVFTTNYSSGCLPYLLCHVSQPFLLNVWMGCGFRIVSVPAWYMAVLFWIWMVFPYVQPIILWGFESRPWSKIILLSCMATACIFPLIPFGYQAIAMLPPLRMLEFVIGCITATTIQTRLHWGWPAISVIILIGFHVMQYYVFVHQPDLCYNEPDFTCSLWSFLVPGPATNPCVPWMGIYFNKFALLWAVLIHWLASSEYLEIKGRLGLLLENCTILRTLSMFSLHLYLGHNTVWGIMDEISKRAHFQDQVDMDISMIATYMGCYLLYLYVQPILDRLLTILCCQSIKDNPSLDGV